MPQLLRRFLLSSLLFMFLTASVEAATTPTTRQWTIDSVEREAIVYAPPAATTTQPSPLVFAWHGHGGTMQLFARHLPIHSGRRSSLRQMVTTTRHRVNPRPGFGTRWRSRS